jgi:uncharacterized protein (DUF2236 family)
VRLDAVSDPGLFGPDSVTWRVQSDPIMWVAGLRALLLQAVHPAAMAGVLDHSDFRADPWGRLRRTADYVGTVAFGSTQEVAAAGARVRGVHAKVRGIDGRTGRTYSARDPHLLLWVHCCEVDSFLTTFQRAGGGLTPAEVDAYYAEQTRAAEVVGLVPAAVPASAAALASYFRRMRPELVADRRTWRAARYVLLPPMPGWMQLTTPARPAWFTVAALAAELLPRWARRLYRLPALPTTDLAATAGLRTLRMALQAAPERYRGGPHLRAARERLAQSDSGAMSGASPAHGG